MIGSGLVGCLLESSGPPVGTTLHDQCVTGLQQRFQCVGIGGGPTHLPIVGDDAPGAQDIVRIRGPFIGKSASEHDVGSLIDGELGTLDEVREVGLEEGQRRIALDPAVGRHPGKGRMVAQRRVQDLEQSQNQNARSEVTCSSRRERTILRRGLVRNGGLIVGRRDMRPTAFARGSGAGNARPSPAR